MMNLFVMIADIVVIDKVEDHRLDLMLIASEVFCVDWVVLHLVYLIFLLSIRKSDNLLAKVKLIKYFNIIYKENIFHNSVLKRLIYK